VAVEEEQGGRMMDGHRQVRFEVKDGVLRLEMPFQIFDPDVEVDVQAWVDENLLISGGLDEPSRQAIEFASIQLMTIVERNR
jgi:hypothetical protein